MLEYLPQAFATLSTASTIAKGMLDLRDFQLLNSKIIELQQAIIAAQGQVLSAQAEHTTLSAKVHELQSECSRLLDWSAQRERYERRQIGGGVFAYVERATANDFKAAHKLCCTCFDKSIPSTLQQTREPMRMVGLTCANGCPKLVFSHYLENL